MNNAISISGSTYTVVGTVKNQTNKKGIADLHVLVYGKGRLRDDFLDIAVTDASGEFRLAFDRSKFTSILDRTPKLYFIVKDAGTELLNTKEQFIKEVNEATPPIILLVNISNDILRKDINRTPVPGWVGGFAQSNTDFAYPSQDKSQDIPPNFESLNMLDNMANIPLIQRQQKVLWPEFSWNSEPDKEDKKRCYQMFAPDISRMGYTDEGRIYSIICPQQGISSDHFGCMNVEVTVTGNRGWVDEKTKELAGDVSVEVKIWFSPSAQEYLLVQMLADHFEKENLLFPSSKEKAMVIKAYNPKPPHNFEFPITRGLTKDFPIPDFAMHEEVAWSKGHLSVLVGEVVKTGNKKVDEFNQLIVDIFNIAGGNMLKRGNILTWNVWFTAPEHVNEEEWENHAKIWRTSLNVDHKNPDGEGTTARYFDGTPFKPIQNLIKEELFMVLNYLKKYDFKIPSILEYIAKYTY